MLILPVTIKVEQSIVVHQPVLSFDHCRGNLKQQSFPISPPGPRAFSAPLSVFRGDEQVLNGD